MAPIIADESRIVHGITVWPVIRWRAGTVTAVGRQWTGVREVVVDVVGDGLTPALAYVALVGSPQPGDRVVLNTTALGGRPGYRWARDRRCLARSATGGPIGSRTPRQGPLHPDPGHRVRGRRTGFAALRHDRRSDVAFRHAGRGGRSPLGPAGHPRRRAPRSAGRPRRLCAD